MSELAALEALLKTRSVLIGDFTLASGARSPYYIDARKTTMSAEGLYLIGRVGLGAIRAAGWLPAAVGGLTMGADPVAYAIARASRDDPPAIDAFSVRKAAKAHGAKRQIEGRFEPIHPVVVVEDVITSGASAALAVEAVREAGGTVLGILAVVDREQGSAQALAGRGIDVVSLTTITRLGIHLSA